MRNENVIQHEEDLDNKSNTNNNEDVKMEEINIDHQDIVEEKKEEQEEIREVQIPVEEPRQKVDLVTVQKMKKTINTPILTREGILLFIIAITEGISLSEYLTFTALMIRKQFGFDENQVGFYAGFVTSAFYVGQMISNYPFGWLSDLWGRKPLILFGLLVNAICQICFALSYWLWWAIAVRFFNGLFNGNIPILSCYGKDFSNYANQARVANIRSIGFAIGAAVAPLIVGIFSEPADYAWFQTLPPVEQKLFIMFPYALPLFITALINLLTFVLGCFFLKETLNSANSYSSTTILPYGPSSTSNSLRSESMSMDDKILHQKKIEAERLERESAAKEDEGYVSYYYNAVSNSVTEYFQFINRGVITTACIFTVTVFTFTMFREAFPVWATRDVNEHGLGFNEFEMGTINSVAGILPIIFLFLFFAPLDRFLGTVATLRYALVLYAPFIFLLPFVQKLIFNNKYEFWGSLVFLFASLVILETWIFSTDSLLVCLIVFFFVFIILTLFIGESFI